MSKSFTLADVRNIPGAKIMAGSATQRVYDATLAGWMSCEIPLTLKSEANLREHWAAKHRRAKAQKLAVATHLMRQRRVRFPAVVTLTRGYCGRAKPMDSDNLARAFKAVRDAVAEWCGVDDKDGAGLTWRYQQRRWPENAVGILIEHEKD